MSTPVPAMNIASAEQVGASLLAYAIVKGGATNADKLARALILQQIASIFSDAAAGDTAAINAEFSTLVGQISDPGLKVIASQAFAFAQPFLSAELALLKGAVGVGSLVDGALTSAAAGFNQVASAYIAAYSKPAA